MQKFKNMEHSNSRTFQGLLKDRMNCDVTCARAMLETTA